MCSDYSVHCLKQNVEAHGPPLLVPQDETPANFGLGSLPDKSFNPSLFPRRSKGEDMTELTWGSKLPWQDITRRKKGLSAASHSVPSSDVR